MRRVELQDLLPAGTVGEQSRRELLHGLTSVSMGALSANFAGGGRLPSSGGTGSSTTGAGENPLQGSANHITDQITELTSQITTLNLTEQTQIGAMQDNTQALSQSTASKSGGSIGSAAGSVASRVFGGGLSLSPILSGLMSLFGGGQTETLAAPPPFRLPTPVLYNAGVTASARGQVVPVSYGSGGQPRSQETSTPPQVTVQVNAMDSQSFLDHSAEIASAVRQALLSSNSLSDVISDL